MADPSLLLNRREAGELAAEALREFLGRRPGKRLVDELGRTVHLLALAAVGAGRPPVGYRTLRAAVELAQRRLQATEEVPTMPLLSDCLEAVCLAPPEEWGRGWPEPRLRYLEILTRLFGRVPNNKACDRLRAECQLRRANGQKLTTALLFEAAGRARLAVDWEPTIPDLLRELDAAGDPDRGGKSVPAVGPNHWKAFAAELSGLSAGQAAEWWRQVMQLTPPVSRGALELLRQEFYRDRREGRL